jgi:hypothetical protein
MESKHVPSEEKKVLQSELTSIIWYLFMDLTCATLCFAGVRKLGGIFKATEYGHEYLSSFLGCAPFLLLSFVSVWIFDFLVEKTPFLLRALVVSAILVFVLGISPLINEGFALRCSGVAIGLLTAVFIVKFPLMCKRVLGHASNRRSYLMSFFILALYVSFYCYLASAKAVTAKDHLFPSSIAAKAFLLACPWLVLVIFRAAARILGDGKEDEEEVFNVFSVSMLALHLVPVAMRMKKCESLLRGFTMLLCILFRYNRKGIPRSRALRMSLLMAIPLVVPYIWAAAKSFNLTRAAE